MSHSHLFRENILTMIGLCLCIYFSYHAVLGSRSVIKLHMLEKQIVTMSQKNTHAMQEKESLQKKVVMMRPGSVNRDLLEEQVRKTLGYRASNEVVVLSN